MKRFTLFLLASILLCACNNSPKYTLNPEETIYLYTLEQGKGADYYDKTLAAACIQGIVNREYPRLYILSESNSATQFWLDKFYDGWMGSPAKQEIESFDELVKWACDKVKGSIIWDENVPATINVATTMAGIEDGIVLTAAMAEEFAAKYGIKVIADLRGRFDGSVSSSAKNDAYLWAKEQYLDKGLCSKHLMCLFEDSALVRENGDVKYIVTRDWAISNKSFVYDLSPWGDEAPADDKSQALGTDLSTYKAILSSQLGQTKGKEMTEITGFFSFWKYTDATGLPSIHQAVQTEWESVFIMSAYNCYQNTVSQDCYNQSFHSKAPQTTGKQGRPETYPTPEEGKTYICIFMADYDSSTPLYDFIPRTWENAQRGKAPLTWGVNPNLCETYPDIMEYLYSTRAEGDCFTSDASCAGYFNPNEIAPENLPLFVEHNKKFFAQWDMSLAPMILDTDEPTPAVKDAFRQFAPDGIAEIVIDFHQTGGKAPATHLWDGMPVTELLNNFCTEGRVTSVENEAQSIAEKLAGPTKEPQFYLVRIVWYTPEEIIAVIDRLKELRPDLDIELLGGYEYFHCLKTICE